MFNVFLEFVRKYYKQALLYFVLLLITNICMIYQPLTLNKVLEKSIFVFDEDTILFILLSFITPLIMLYKDRTLNYVTNLMSIDVSTNLIANMLHKDVLELKKKTSNYIVRIIFNYSWLVSDFYLYTLLDSFFSLMTALIILVILSKYSLPLALFILIAHILRLLTIFSLQPKLQVKATEKITTENDYFGTFTNYVIKLKSIITRNKVCECNSILSSQKAACVKTANSYASVRSISTTLGQTAFWIIRFTSILFGMHLSAAYGLSLISLQLAFSYSNEIGVCLKMVSELLPTFSDLKANAKHVDSLECIENTKSRGFQENFSSIHLKDVSFGYDDKIVLKSINEDFEKGNIYVIHGENGSGKSTLMKIISGLYTKYKGEIFLDDKSLSEYNIEHFLNHYVSILTQDDILLEGTVIENLLSSDERNIQLLAKKFNISDLSRTINSNGTNLSGGEKRKILLARFFLDVLKKKPKLIILDEPTYALEKETITKVIHLITTLAKDAIVLVISHNQEDFINEKHIHLKP